MSIAAQCQQCGQQYQLADRFAGERLSCRICQTAMIVPSLPREIGALPPSHAPDAPESENDARWASFGVIGATLLLAITIVLTAAYIVYRASQPSAAEQLPPIAAPRGGDAGDLPPPRARSRELAADPSSATPWRVKVDPPRIRYQVSLSPIRINIPGGSNDSGCVVYSSTASPFVAVGSNSEDGNRRELWDLLTIKKVGEIDQPFDLFERLLISPDGQYLLGRRFGRVQVWSFVTGQKVCELRPGDEQRTRLEGSRIFVDFGPPGEVVASDDYTEELLVFSIETGTPIRTIPLHFATYFDAYAMSPGRNYLAVMSSDRVLNVIQLSEGSLAGRPSLPTRAQGSNRFAALTFSADGRELAGLYGNESESAILAWDVSTGELIADIPLDLRLERSADNTHYLGSSLEWLADKSGWLVYGAHVIPRTPGKPVITMSRLWNEWFRMGPPRCLPGNRLLCVGGRRKSAVLEAIPLPSD